MFLSVKLPSHSSSALENSLRPWIGIYRKTTCTSIRQNSQTNLHCTVYPSIPVLSLPFLLDTKPPNLGFQNMFDSRRYKLFAGIPSKASWHLGFLRWNIHGASPSWCRRAPHCAAAAAHFSGNDGRLHAQERHKRVALSARWVLTALSCAISPDVSTVVMLDVR